MSFKSSKERIGKEEIIESEEKSRILEEVKLFFTPINVVILSLAVAGFIALLQVGVVIWTDITFWGKDINLIFFGSRVGENISLGFGLKIIHYYLIGILLIFSAVIILFLKKWKVFKIKL